MAAAKTANRVLKARGLPAHRLVRIEPQVDAQLERKMPLVACLRCGATGAARAISFARRCEPPTPAGRAVLARLDSRLAPKVSSRVAVEAHDLSDGDIDDVGVAEEAGLASEARGLDAEAEDGGCGALPGPWSG